MGCGTMHERIVEDFNLLLDGVLLLFEIADNVLGCVILQGHNHGEDGERLSFVEVQQPACGHLWIL